MVITRENRIRCAPGGSNACLGCDVRVSIAIAAEPIPLTTQRQWLAVMGSVGQPRDGDWRACYAIYDLDHHLVVFRRVEYDIETTQKKILDAGLPPMLAERLADGR